MDLMHYIIIIIIIAFISAKSLYNKLMNLGLASFAIVIHNVVASFFHVFNFSGNHVVVRLINVNC